MCQKVRARFQVADHACSAFMERYAIGKILFCFSRTLYFCRMGSLIPQGGQCTAMYAQLYVCGGSAELDERMQLNKNLAEQTMRDLQTMLHAVNPYIQTYKTAKERLGDNPAGVIFTYGGSRTSAASTDGDTTRRR